MTKSKAVKIVQDFCAALDMGKGHKKFMDLHGSDNAPAPLADFKTWWKGQGKYVIRIWPPFHYTDSPWHKYAIDITD